MPSLDSDRADRKVPALVEQAQRGEDADYAALIRALDENDPAVRFAAARSLRTLTDEDFGYRFFDDRLTRRAAVRRWEDWLIARQSGTEVAAATPPPPVAADSSPTPDPTP